MVICPTCSILGWSGIYQIAFQVKYMHHLLLLGLGCLIHSFGHGWLGVNGQFQIIEMGGGRHGQSSFSNPIASMRFD